MSSFTKLAGAMVVGVTLLAVPLAASNVVADMFLEHVVKPQIEEGLTLSLKGLGQTLGVNISDPAKVVVDRSHKGDRLLVPVPVVAPIQAPKKVPEGCERVGSPIVDPKLADYFGRCLS